MRSAPQSLSFIALFFLMHSTTNAAFLEVSIHPGPIGSGRAKANIEFDGQSKTCLVDTGAWGTVLRGRKADGASSLGRAQTLGISGDHVDSEMIQVREVRAQSWVKNDFTIWFTEILPESCILGSDFFRSESLSINLKEGKISAQATFAGKTHPLLSYGRESDPRFGFEVNIGGRSAASLFDTGAELTVVDRQLVAEHPRSFQFIQSVDIIDASNKKLQAGLYRVETIKFGDWEARGIYVLARDLSQVRAQMPKVRVILGFNIIANHHWYIDTRSQRWAIYQLDRS